MATEYFVLRNGKVVYEPGHYDEDGATGVAKNEARAHPNEDVHVVKIVCCYHHEEMETFHMGDMSEHYEN